MRSVTTTAAQRPKNNTPAKGSSRPRPLTATSSTTPQKPQWQSIRSKQQSATASRSPNVSNYAPNSAMARSVTPGRQAPPPPASFTGLSLGGDVAAKEGGQFKLFSQLQEVVVQLSQCAVSEKQKFSHMQKRLDAYAQLVKEQDRMIEELKALNSKLVKEKEALMSFRHVDTATDDRYLDDIAVEERHAEHGDLSVNTPKSKQFMQSLISQLREEKRQRLAVEEQSSRMIGEQQLAIHRLEEKAKQTHGHHISPQRASHSGAATRQTLSPAAPVRQPAVEPTSHQAEQPPPAVTAPFPSPPASTIASRTSSTSLAVGSAAPPLAFGSSAVSTTSSTATSIEDAAVILQEIRRRHGL